jgi:hypothetical protein
VTPPGSWSDCFNASTPTSSNGWIREWFDSEVGSVQKALRIASGV